MESIESKAVLLQVELEIHLGILLKVQANGTKGSFNPHAKSPAKVGSVLYVKSSES